MYSEIMGQMKAYGNAFKFSKREFGRNSEGESSAGLDTYINCAGVVHIIDRSPLGPLYGRFHSATPSNDDAHSAEGAGKTVSPKPHAPQLIVLRQTWCSKGFVPICATCLDPRVQVAIRIRLSVLTPFWPR